MKLQPIGTVPSIFNQLLIGNHDLSKTKKIGTLGCFLITNIEQVLDRKRRIKRNPQNQDGLTFGNTEKVLHFWKIKIATS